MIHFEGQLWLGIPVTVAADRLADAGYLAQSLKDAEILSASPEKAAWRIKPKITFLSGTQTTELIRTDYQPQQSVTFGITTRSIGASAVVVAHLRFSPEAEGTQVHWSADITELTGLLKMVPSGLVQQAAQQVIQEIWDNVQQRLAEESRSR
jgi:carbon monoxide dehydrogenase subunit G